MKKKVNIQGVLIPNDYKWYYDTLEEDSTCPKDVQKVIDALSDGDEIEVYINSPGGVIEVGSEIYTLLRSHSEKVKIYITGEACSAASVVAMAAYCEMAPTALMMVHCVSTSANGNHNYMEHAAEVLRTADRALCRAYMEKTGMSEREALEMMESETWLTAEKAREMGLIDGVMFTDQQPSMAMVAGPLFTLPNEEKMAKVKKMLKQADSDKESAFFIQQKLNLLKMKGDI